MNKYAREMASSELARNVPRKSIRVLMAVLHEGHVWVSRIGEYKSVPSALRALRRLVRGNAVSGVEYGAFNVDGQLIN